MLPELRIIDKNFNLKGVVDTYTSFQGERSLWEVGTFELHVGFRDQGADALREGNLIMLDEKRAWEITGVKTTEDDDLMLVVTGREIKGILSQRIVVPGGRDDQTSFGWDRFPAPNNPDAAAESIIKHYVSAHAAQPVDTKRKFPRLTVATDRERGMKTRWSERFKPLHECLADIGEYTGMGYSIALNLASKQLVFDVIPEKIQTVGSENPVTFSIDFENIENLVHTIDTSKDVTIAYAGGAGEDENRLIQAVSRNESDAALSGYSRKEKWFDCGSHANIDDLLYEAKYQLSKVEPSESLVTQVLPNSSFQYMQDWDLGSIVSIQSRALGLSQDKKVTSVKEVYERGKYQIIPTFGKRNKNIIDEIRKREVVR